MVAKSYQQYKITGDPYTVSGKQYVKIETATGLKQVRWYSDAEYQKMYAADTPAHTNDPYWRSQKAMLGFNEGPVFICKGLAYEDKDLVKELGAKYHSSLGWFFLSNNVPTVLPAGVELIQITWEQVGTDTETLKSAEQIKTILDSLLYPIDETTEFVGAIGERIELFLIVDKAIDLEGAYGHSTMHIMHDDDGNIFVWTTAAKHWTVQSEHHLVGTIKDHKVYKGDKQTILTRCREVN